MKVVKLLSHLLKYMSHPPKMVSMCIVYFKHHVVTSIAEVALPPSHSLVAYSTAPGLGHLDSL